MSIDQTRQQNNACIKEMVKLLASLKNQNALWCWMVSSFHVQKLQGPSKNSKTSISRQTRRHTSSRPNFNFNKQSYRRCLMAGECHGRIRQRFWGRQCGSGRPGRPCVEPSFFHRLAGMEWERRWDVRPVLDQVTAGCWHLPWTGVLQVLDR